jgi:gluconate kinase
MVEPILFVLGPSGAGKTTLGQSLTTELGMLHIDFDQWPENGVDREGLRPEWEKFLAGNLQSLADAIRKRMRAGTHCGAVVTCPSKLVLPRDLFAAAEPLGYRFIILYGTGAECLEGFLRGEHVARHGLSEDHWIDNNAWSYAVFSRSEFDDYRIAAFDTAGFRPRLEVLAEIEQRLVK